MDKTLIVTSPAFEEGGLIPIQYTDYGADISPELHLAEIDHRAKSLAVIMNDMDIRFRLIIIGLFGIYWL